MKKVGSKITGPLDLSSGVQIDNGKGGISPELSALLGMSYGEAASISPKRVDMPPFFRIAADEIEVLRTKPDGSPKTVRAKGKVYIKLNLDDPAVALCQEAYITNDELILRGRPVLQRGGSVIEGMHDSTVFYILGYRLRVIGMHRLARLSNVVPDMPGGAGPWSAGPNPLLPPLSPSAVPTEIRMEMLKAAEAEAAGAAMLKQSRPDASLVVPEGSVLPLIPPEEPKPATPSAPPAPVTPAPPPAEKTPPTPEPVKPEAEKPPVPAAPAPSVPSPAAPPPK